MLTYLTHLEKYCRFYLNAIVATLLIILCQPALAQPPTFQSAFSNNMVLPHNKAVVLKGRATPGAKLTLRALGKDFNVSTDHNGVWRYTIPKLTAGKTYDISISDKHGVKTILANVLAGELWLCSGQSNMEYAVSASIDQPKQYNQGHPSIRLLTVPQDIKSSPQTEFVKPTDWQQATSKTVSRFSAVCYFFARKRFQETGIPLGLINASWGGSALEPWLSQDTLKGINGYTRKVQQLQQYQVERRSAELSFLEDWKAWWKINSKHDVWRKGILDKKGDWRNAPLKDWRTYPNKKMKNHLGNIWFSTSFELSQEQLDKGARVALGRIDEVDTTWVNGKFINNTFGYGTRREYKLEPEILKVGTNQITTFITNTSASGGMKGPAEDVGIIFDDGEFIALGHNWKYQFIPTAVGYPPRAPWESVSGVSGMFNTMISPLVSLPLTGVIWYQGESNVGSANNYRVLLSGLIDDWRMHFNSKDMPFVIIQLPNFGTNHLTKETGPAESGWATVRYAQQQTALSDRQVGLVVTHDLGNDSDIHPKRKFEVGVRTAEIVKAIKGFKLKNAIIIDGIEASIESKAKNIATLKFSSPLRLIQDDIKGFALCRKAKDCTFTTAMQNKEVLDVDLSIMPDAHFIRYCWSDGGHCDLQAANGTPVSSFQLGLVN